MDNSTGHQVDIGSAVMFPRLEQSSAPRARHRSFFQLCSLDDGGVTGLVSHSVQRRLCQPLGTHDRS
jgi:hypothetical protein